MATLGDFHVGRMYPYSCWLGQHTIDVSVKWIWGGGAGINCAEQQVGRHAGFRQAVIMMCGNDLVTGMCSPYQLAERMGY